LVYLSRVYFGAFNAFETDPGLFLNRETERDWLLKSIQAWLGRSQSDDGRQSWCVHGPKGSGKTIFARKVLDDVRAVSPKHLASTLFVEVDCRRLNSSREVYKHIAYGCVRALDELRSAHVKVAEALLDMGRAFRAIASLEGNVETQVARETLTRFQATLGGKTTSALSKALEGTFGLTFEASQKTTHSLKAMLRFDDAWLCLALSAYFRDLRAAGFRVLLFVDNIDELQHEYDTEEVRRRARAQADWVLELAEAPIGMLVCMRSYFSTIARTMHKRALTPLGGNHLVGILEKRVTREAADLKRRFAETEVKLLTHWLAGRAPTPLAYLQWFQNLAERDAWDSASREAAITEVIRSEYANVPFDLIERVVALYPRVDSEVVREKILEACEGNASELAVLQDRQVVLPNDFWNPTRFTLDPFLQVLRALRS
jgi:hypothetical protein